MNKLNINSSNASLLAKKATEVITTSQNCFEEQMRLREKDGIRAVVVVQ